MSVPGSGPAIVVGVDGSPASAAALRWAAEQGRALRAEVVAVHVWEPSGPRIAPYAPAAARPEADEERIAAARVLAETVRGVMGPRVAGTVRAELIEGPPARVLPRRARHAALLVLGHTMHPQHTTAAGPVGRECLRRATVPVVTVPAPAATVTRLAEHRAAGRTAAT
ncbi:universal stress protein [Streptomyces sp. NPDC006997]|uniref:universal stress protein n=1 Tax=Streptomyces sp. NPDC006997 TaxID=3155356 RepID=UPI0033ECD93A